MQLFKLFSVIFENNIAESNEEYILNSQFDISLLNLTYILLLNNFSSIIILLSCFILKYILVSFLL
ncbi:hypothetical protein AMV065 [Betaentomopoxvirus amoorei]|uniref:AMV065 n=1 Tax=Amsacta moorei entomopoxvirus TaxID=28321 RepID=Q9EMY4_AMEPV|nr:hypothetical protein AMV065 [Amsacta moorei entomopoxvirus]AAG02771.1 AMV065 [Amsacta moorei entomopoxvirus]